MDDQLQQYLGEQLALFQGGYEHIRLQFDVHFLTYHDEVQLGVVLFDGPTGEWIAAEVHQEHCSVRDAEAIAPVIADIIAMARGHLSPF